MSPEGIRHFPNPPDEEPTPESIEADSRVPSELEPADREALRGAIERARRKQTLEDAAAELDRRKKKAA